MEFVIAKAKEYFSFQYLKLEERVYEVAKSLAEVSSRSISEVENRSRSKRRVRGKKRSKKV
jgi:hypothetical protein